MQKLIARFADNAGFNVPRLQSRFGRDVKKQPSRSTQVEAKKPEFDYASLPGDSIRLMTLDGLGDDDRLLITLKDYVLASAPEYDALSYAWNNEKPSRFIWSNGLQLLITESLCGALYMLTKSGSTRPLWADAICINQANDAEKAVQVPMMGAIFSQAETVYAWLGPAGPHTDVAMDNIIALETILKNEYGSLRSSNTALQSYGLPLKDDPIWKGLGDILRRPWLVRLWVVQEIVLAKSAVLWCGFKRIPLRHLFLLSNFVKRRGLENLTEMEGMTVHGQNGLIMFRKCIEYKENGRPYPLNEMMERVRDRETSEPIDKIYAILGLADPSIRKQIHIDYTETNRREYWKTYLRLAHVLLSESNDLASLCNGLPQERVAELPSWCTNFNSKLVGVTILSTEITFTAGGSYPDTTEPAHVASSRDGLKITLRGFIVDTVEEVVMYQYYESNVHPISRVDIAWLDKMLGIIETSSG